MLMFTAFLLEGCRIGSVSQTDLATEYFSQNRIIWACTHLDNDIIAEFSVHIYIETQLQYLPGVEMLMLFYLATLTPLFL